MHTEYGLPAYFIRIDDNCGIELRNLVTLRILNRNTASYDLTLNLIIITSTLAQNEYSAVERAVKLFHP